MYLPQLMVRKPWYRLGKPSSTYQLRRRRLVFESTRVASVCEAGYLRGGSFTKDKLRGSAEGCTYIFDYCSANVYKGTTRRWGNTRKRWNKLPEAHAVKNAKIERLYNKRARGAGLKETATPQWASVSPGPKAALNQS